MDDRKPRTICRSKLRYPGDLTDKEWAIVEPLIPAGKRGGGKCTVVLREVVNGLIYVLSTGCQWRAVPKDLPPRSTLFGYFDDGCHRQPECQGAEKGALHRPVRV